MIQEETREQTIEGWRRAWETLLFFVIIGGLGSTAAYETKAFQLVAVCTGITTTLFFIVSLIRFINWLRIPLPQKTEKEPERPQGEYERYPFG